jgi:cytochrome oxidase Cu insertion factor (SCO1/SenC/PrrC family)
MYKRLLACIIILHALFTVVLIENVLAKNLQEELKRIFPWEGPQVGSVVKDFELKTYDGRNFRLSDQRGKIVVLEMGACT